MGLRWQALASQNAHSSIKCTAQIEKNIHENMKKEKIIIYGHWLCDNICNFDMLINVWNDKYSAKLQEKNKTIWFSHKWKAQSPLLIILVGKIDLAVHKKVKKLELMNKSSILSLIIKHWLFLMIFF